MSRFSELCEAYALAKKRTEASRQSCRDFVKVFVERMGIYFECPIKAEKISFDQSNTLHFDTSITLYEFPQNPSQGSSEILIVSWSLQKILDNYIIMVFPWVRSSYFMKYPFSYNYVSSLTTYRA
ncbi:MAG: hypothetical protein QNJ54_25880 [Prochloraceae cyanobacterium]|nr:hypothetical protein [Prochloraceae cyanobacterium]